MSLRYPQFPTLGDVWTDFLNVDPEGNPQTPVQEPPPVGRIWDRDDTHEVTR